MFQGTRRPSLALIINRRLLILPGVILLIAGILACGGESNGSPGEEIDVAAPVQSSDAASSVTPGPVNVEGRLYFPQRTVLTFERAGEVDEVLVSAGQSVTEGQVLARLKSDHFPLLEEEIARLRFQIAEARNNIKLINLDYSGEPLLVAQREENVARLELANTQAQDLLDDIDQNYNDRLTAAISERDQAQNALDAANDALSDVQRDLDADHEQVIAAAEQTEADAELALDLARERLQDYREDLSDEAIRAGDQVTRAELALDQAVDRLEDYKEDIQQGTIRSRDRVTEAEVALDLHREALQDFLDEHERRVIRARTMVGAADEALDFAKAPLTQFLREPIRDTELDGNPVDVAKLNSLQAAVDLAEANLTKAEEDLVELQEGPDSLRIQELRSNVTVAELNLSQAEDDLAELEEGPDPVLLQELESNVTVATLNLERARDSLAELEEGPDILVLNQLQSRVNLAEVNLEQARKRLTEAEEGPDELIVPRLELNVTLAQRRLDLSERELEDLIEEGPNRDSVEFTERQIASRRAQIDDLFEAPDAVKLAQIASLEASIYRHLERIGDIEEEMDEYSLVAPANGILYLVNVEGNDQVSKHSQVMELLDPGEVIIKGFVDAIDVKHVNVGSQALVNLESLPGQELTGSVIYLAEDPRTERGVISYEVVIQVDLEPGQQVPLRLSAVDAVVLP